MTTTPAQAEHYPTFIDAVVAGVRDLEIDDYVEQWHEGEDQSNGAIHAFLGMTEDEYHRWVMDPSALDAIVAERRAAIDGPQDGPIKLSFGIPASKQESSFMNATLSGLESGHAISIAVTPPRDFPASDPTVMRTMVNAAFRRLVDLGFEIEMQVGPDDQA